jgi:hypothetical protein
VLRCGSSHESVVYGPAGDAVFRKSKHEFAMSPATEPQRWPLESISQKVAPGYAAGSAYVYRSGSRPMLPSGKGARHEVGRRV